MLTSLAKGQSTAEPHQAFRSKLVQQFLDYKMVELQYLGISLLFYHMLYLTSIMFN